MAEDVTQIQVVMTADVGPVVEAKKRLEDLERQAKDLDAQLQSGYVSKSQFDAGMKSIARESKAAAKELKAAEDAAAKARGGMGNFGQSMLNVGRIVQDFSAAGILGITNNMEGLAVALGLGSGVAGVATLAAVGLQLLLPHIRAFVASLDTAGVNLFTEGLADLKKQAEALEAKPVKLTVDMLALDRVKAQIDRIEAAIAHVNALAGKQTEPEAASGKGVDEALVNAPGGSEAVRRKLGERRFAELMRDSQPLKEARAEYQKLLAEQKAFEESVLEGTFAGDADAAAMMGRDFARRVKEAGAMASAMQDAIERDAFTKGGFVGQLIQRAAQGKGADQAKANAELARRLEEAGMGDLAEQIRAASPAATKAGIADRKLVEDLNAQGKAMEGPSLEELRKAQREQKDALDAQARAAAGVGADIDAAALRDAREQKVADRAALAEHKQAVELGKGLFGDEARNFLLMGGSNVPGGWERMQGTIAQGILRNNPGMGHAQAMFGAADVMAGAKGQALEQMARDGAKTAKTLDQMLQMMERSSRGDRSFFFWR